MNEIKEQVTSNLTRGLSQGAFYAGLVAPVAAVIVIASWLKGGNSSK
jgi:hypothetical protein